MRFSVLLDTLHPFKDAGVVVDKLKGIYTAMVKCLFIVKRSCIHKGILSVPIGKNLKDSNSGRHAQ
jgi:hypothetical protein